MLLPQQLKTSVFLPWGQRGERQSLFLKLEENVVKKGQNGCGSCQKGECNTLFKPQVQLSLWSAARVCICPCAVCVWEMCVSKCLGACMCAQVSVRVNSCALAPGQQQPMKQWTLGTNHINTQNRGEIPHPSTSHCSTSSARFSALLHSPLTAL